MQVKIDLESVEVEGLYESVADLIKEEVVSELNRQIKSEVRGIVKGSPKLKKLTQLVINDLNTKMLEAFAPK
jgi:hypothetical protein